MKLIVSGLDALRRYVSREFYYIITDLVANYGWTQVETHKLWRGPGTLAQTLVNEFGEIPETMLFWEGYEFIEAHARDILRLECHKAIMADDLHWWNYRMRQRKSAAFALCDTVLSTYGYAWNKFYPEFCNSKRLAWIPHSASPDFMLRYNEHPQNTIFLSGAMTPHYPLRREMNRLHEQRAYRITQHWHPGYHCEYDYQRDEAVGQGYAKKINRYRVGFTDSLKYGYVVAKYFEIPATGALLLADANVSKPLRQLGFIENQHYIPVTRENLEKQIRYVLDEANFAALDRIRQSGRDLVWERHKTSDRAKQINDVCAV